ncbi:MAG: T9SS type A sorting domain-containing protein [Candidatus Stygibacter frigidus]|nr:T9SS type A sorting domain-containing protein [Candidatus Stygibacter frigidus]
MQIVEKSDSNWNYATDYIYLATGDVSDILTGTIDDEIVISPQFNCYPNPFNPEINLAFNLDHTGFVEITIYNIKGQLVDQVIKDTYSAGDHTCTWNAPAGSSGIYLAQYKLNSELISCRKLTLLK